MPKTPTIPRLFFGFMLPASLWIGFFALRPALIHPWCAVQPTPCLASAVNGFDRIVFQFHSLLADFLSNLLQNSVGVLMVLVPILMLQNWKRALQINLILGMGALWNGAMLELVRTLAQRPRPLVMANPMGDGANIHQYTSFYSGHTSFVAYATLSTYFWMRAGKGEAFSSPEMNELSRNKRSRVQFALIAYVSLTLLTAILRVLGGRHYPTDAVAGAIGGSLVAWVIWNRMSESAVT